MKKNLIKTVVILFLVFSLSGCTKVLKDNEKKPVINNITGQSLTANIICKPEGDSKETKETIKQYKKNNVNVEKLPKCSEFKITDGGYEGIWTTIFIKPLAWFIIKVGELVKSYGLAVILITILIRLILYPITKKTAIQSENMKKAQPALQNIEKKYQNKNMNDQTVMMQKSQEMMNVYKEYNINPMSGCLFSFLQIPLFFAFYESLSRIPSLFEDKFLIFHLGTSPMAAFSKGNYYYIIIIILVIATTYFSMKLNKTASMSEEQESQMKMMTNMMIIFISIASLSVSVGIALYWITNSAFTIIQNLIVKKEK